MCDIQSETINHLQDHHHYEREENMHAAGAQQYSALSRAPLAFASERVSPGVFPSGDHWKSIHVMIKT